MKDKVRADKLNEFLLLVTVEQFRKFSHQRCAYPCHTNTPLCVSMDETSMVLHSTEVQKRR